MPTDTAYLLLPELGKYIFAPVTSGKTQVDFSEAKEATEHRLNIPADASWPVIFLDGHPREGDYSKRMLLYFGPVDQLLYPSTGIEEFNMKVAYIDAQHYIHEYFYVGKSMPTDLGFETKADFTVAKAEFNDFRIQFGEEVPASYFMEWASEELKLNWRIYLSPEETAFKPQDYLQNLSAAHLEGVDLSGFSPKSVTTYKAEGYTHQSLHDYLNNPDAVRRYELKQYRTIEKKFR